MVYNLPDFSPDRDIVEDYIDYLGDEWSDKNSLVEVLHDFVYPYVSKDITIMGEIGSGGGRVSTKLAQRVKQLVCYDISKNMLDIAQARVSLEHPTLDTEFVHLETCQLPLKFVSNVSGYFDYICVFDVFPHVDLHTQWGYYQEIRKSLKILGYALIHTANLETAHGWNRFAQQKEFSAKGFYFMVPDMVRLLLNKAGLTIVDESLQNKNPSNLYYSRDYIALVQRKE